MVAAALTDVARLLPRVAGVDTAADDRLPRGRDVPRKADSETILAVGAADTAWRCAEELAATRGATHTVLAEQRMASMVKDERGEE